MRNAMLTSWAVSVALFCCFICWCRQWTTFSPNSNTRSHVCGNLQGMSTFQHHNQNNFMYENYINVETPVLEIHFLFKRTSFLVSEGIMLHVYLLVLVTEIWACHKHINDPIYLCYTRTPYQITHNTQGHTDYVAYLALLVSLLEGALAARNSESASKKSLTASSGEM